MKLLKLTLTLNTHKLDFSVSEYEGDEKGKSYVLHTLYYKYPDGRIENESVSKRVSFEKILKPESKFLEMHRLLIYSTWCTPETLDKAKFILKEKVKKSFDKIIEDFNKTKTLYNRIDELT